MTIEGVVHNEDSTLFKIHEPTRYGVPDIHREVTVSHKPEEIAKLPTITPSEILALTDDPGNENVTKVDSYQKLPNGVTLVFLQNYDLDWSSNSYRDGAYSVRGPFRVISEK